MLRLTNMMEKEALGTRFVASAMSRANRAGKFAGKAGIARRNKFVKTLQKWIGGHKERLGSHFETLQSAEAVLPYSQLSRVSGPGGFGPGPTQFGLGLLPMGPTRDTMKMYQPHKKVLDKLHNAFSIGNPAHRAAGFKPPRVNLQSNKRVVENWMGRGHYSPEHGGRVYSSREIPTLMHEMGHAYTMGPDMELARGLVKGFGKQTHMGAPGRSVLITEAQANRAAVNAILNLQGKSGIKNFPTTKQYRAMAKPQYENYVVDSLKAHLEGDIIASEVPAWIKRMGLPVRRGRPSAESFKKYL